MIQRRQTIWWFLTGVLFILMIPFDWMSLVVSDGDYLFAANGVSKTGETIVTGWPLMAYVIAMAVLNFVIIGLFKKRILQSRLTMISIVMSICFYLVILMYKYMSFEGDVVETFMSWPLILPLINTILGVMAFRDVLKDEALVRSLDRLR